LNFSKRANCLIKNSNQTQKNPIYDEKVKKALIYLWDLSLKRKSLSEFF